MRSRLVLLTVVAGLIGACSDGDTGNGGTSSGGSAGDTSIGGPAGAVDSAMGTGGAVGEDGSAGAGGMMGTGGSSGTGGAAGGDGVGGTGGFAGADGGRAGGSPGSGGVGDGGISGDASSTSLLVYPPAAGAGDLAAGIAQLNLYRALVGESPVTLDSASSTGCEGHVAYLIEESTKLGQSGFLSHQETDTANSHFSAANSQAGVESDLAWGTAMRGNTVTYQSLAQAVDLWINGVYHRRPLLNPGLVKVGAASSTGYNCLDYAAAGNTTVVVLNHASIWPVDGMTDVPRTFGGNEGPCPTASDPQNATTCPAGGFIPSATFYGWGTNRMSAIRALSAATLTDVAAGTVIPLFAYYGDMVAGHDPAPGFVRDEVALVPQMSLGANRVYRVDLTGMFQGAQAGQSVTNLSWQFASGTRAN